MMSGWRHTPILIVSAILLVLSGRTLAEDGGAKVAEADKSSATGQVSETGKVSEPNKGSETGPLVFLAHNFPPFVWEEGGVIKGPCLEIASLVLTRANIPHRIEFRPLRRGTMMMQSKSVDGQFPLLYVPNRTGVVAFSKPIVWTSYGLFSLNGQHLPATFSAMENYTIAAFGPSGTFSRLQQLILDGPDIRLEQEVDAETPFRKLNAGRYPELAAVFSNSDVGHYVIKKDSLNKLKLARKVEEIDYRIGFSGRDLSGDLIARIDQAIHSSEEDGSIAEILKEAHLQVPETISQ